MQIWVWIIDVQVSGWQVKAGGVLHVTKAVLDDFIINHELTVVHVSCKRTLFNTSVG